MRPQYYIRRGGFTLVAAIKKVSQIIILIITIIPIILFGLFILLFGVRIPHWDDWKLIVDLVEKYYTGTLTLYDFSEPYNGYILIFPKMLYVSLGVITKLNMLYNLAFLWFFMILSLVILFFAFKKSFGHHKNYLLYFIPVPWLLFTLAQWENLIYGTTVCGYISMFGFLVALYYLDTFKSNVCFLISIIGGILSTFSSITGLLIWPLGLLLLICTKGIKNVYTYIWMIISGIISSVYFLNWIYPAQELLTTENSNFIVNNVAYFITNVGVTFGPMESPLNSNILIVFLFGVTTILLSIGIITVLIKRKLLCGNIFWFCLLSYSFLISFETMLVRAQYGLIQATSPRYVLFTIFSVIGLYCLILVVNYDNTNNKKNWPRYTLYVFILMIICSLLNGYIGAYHSLNERHESENTIYTQTLLNYNTETDEELIKNVHPNVLFIRDKIGFIDKYNLSIFNRQH
jgi:hypothetical protein